ncbi:MAG: hypothetical protein C4329_00285 [Chitinophagaceae bacterium]
MNKNSKTVSTKGNSMNHQMRYTQLTSVPNTIWSKKYLRFLKVNVQKNRAVKGKITMSKNLETFSDVL